MFLLAVRIDSTDHGRSDVTIRAVLVSPEGPLNVGAAARACANHGASLVVVDPRCDLTSREARMMAAGARAALDDARVCATLDEALIDAGTVVAFSATRKEAARERAFSVDDARQLLTRDEPLTLLFGTEANGLDDDALSRAHRVLRLPTTGYASMNVAHAVQCALTICSLASFEDVVRAGAPSSTRDALAEGLLVALDETGFFSRSTSAQFRPRMRAMVERMDLDTHEMTMLADMVARLRRARGARDLASPVEDPRG